MVEGIDGGVRESAPWKCVEAVPAISFNLEGQAQASSVRARTTALPRRMCIATAEGSVIALEGNRLILDDGDVFALRFLLPSVIDLGVLLGTRVRVTLRTDPRAGGPAEQLLTISDHEARVRMIARFGPAEADVHAVGEVRLRAALSQRPGGPMVFGTPQLQCAVQVGQHVTVRDGRSAFVMHLVARTASGYAAYVIVDRELWRGAR